MPSDEDVFVVIVGDEDEDILQVDKNAFPSVDEQTFEEFVKTLEMQQNFLEEKDIKQEIFDEEIDIKLEYVEDPQDQNSYQHDTEVFPDVISPVIDNSVEFSDPSTKKGSKKSKPITVSRIKRDNPEFKKNQQLLIRKLVDLMLKEKPPPTPDNIYKKYGSKFKCTFCKAVTDKHGTAIRHYREYHGARYLHCYGCGADFRSTGNFYKHEKRCVSADAVTILKARAMFLGRKGRSRPFLTKTPFLKGIVQTIEEYEAGTIMNTKKGPTRLYQCKDCGANFKSKNHWIGHCNLHKGVRPYQCDQCPASYTTAAGLSKHITKHLGPRYICDYCGRNLSNKNALKMHIDTHFKKKKFACKECNKRYAQSGALTLHVYKIHRKMPPPCICEVCSKGFYRTYLLKEHMMKEHGMLLVTRSMFYRSLPTMPNEDLEKILVKQEIPF